MLICLSQTNNKACVYCVKTNRIGQSDQSLVVLRTHKMEQVRTGDTEAGCTVQIGLELLTLTA